MLLSPEVGRHKRANHRTLRQYVQTFFSCRSGGTSARPGNVPSLKIAQTVGIRASAKIRAGFEMIYDFPQPTSLIMVPTRRKEGNESPSIISSSVMTS